MSRSRRELPYNVLLRVLVESNHAGKMSRRIRELTKIERERKRYKTYKGNMKNGLPHGKGTMKIKGGEFNGTWKNGIPQKGTLVKKYGVYTGNLKNGVPNGRGTYESSSAILNGNWKGGKMHGKGKEIKKSTHAQSGYVQYNGNWKNGKMHGTGNYQRLISGAFYSGQFKNGKQHGIGVGRKRNSEPVLDGRWENGKYIGPA